MSKTETKQDSRSAAEVYEEFFVPALFQGWANQVADAANIKAGMRVLDVACGTGVLARAVAERVSPNGSVVGLDLNEEMLAVAKRKAPKLEWQHGRAEALPFTNNSFDAVVSQFGLTFFENQQLAIREMMRVLRPGGQMTVAVFDALEHSPGYAALTALLQKLFGDEIANAMRPPFVLGDKQTLQSLFTDAGLPDAEITTKEGTVRFPSIQAMISTERACVWTLGGLLDEAQFELLRKEAELVLKDFVTADGTVAFAAPAHIVTATKS